MRLQPWSLPWVEQFEMVMDDNQSADYNLAGDDDVVGGVSITVSTLRGSYQRIVPFLFIIFN